MEREESTTVVGDLPAGGVVHPDSSIISSVPAPDVIAPAQFWRDYLNSWIGGSRGQFLASSVRGGSEAPPARPQRDAFSHPQSEQVTMTGRANVTDCATGGETCAPKF
jgi:hypothetical protein